MSHHLNLQTLPNEILIRILDHLSPKDITELHRAGILFKDLIPVIKDHDGTPKYFTEVTTTFQLPRIPYKIEGINQWPLVVFEITDLGKFLVSQYTKTFVEIYKRTKMIIVISDPNYRENRDFRIGVIRAPDNKTAFELGYYKQSLEYFISLFENCHFVFKRMKKVFFVDVFLQVLEHSVSFENSSVEIAHGKYDFQKQKGKLQELESDNPILNGRNVTTLIRNVNEDLIQIYEKSKIVNLTLRPPKNAVLRFENTHFSESLEFLHITDGYILKNLLFPRLKTLIIDFFHGQEELVFQDIIAPLLEKLELTLNEFQRFKRCRNLNFGSSMKSIILTSTSERGTMNHTQNSLLPKPAYASKEFLRVLGLSEELVLIDHHVRILGLVQRNNTNLKKLKITDHTNLNNPDAYANLYFPSLESISFIKSLIIEKPTTYYAFGNLVAPNLKSLKFYSRVETEDMIHFITSIEGFPLLRRAHVSGFDLLFDDEEDLATHPVPFPNLMQLKLENVTCVSSFDLEKISVVGILTPKLGKIMLNRTSSILVKSGQIGSDFESVPSRMIAPDSA